MAYTKKDWVSGETPLSAENMNHIEQGIADAHKDISLLNTKIDTNGSIDKLAEFTGTSATDVNLSYNLQNYKLMILSVFDSSGAVVGSEVFPVGTFLASGLTIKAYGADANTWGSASNSSYTSVRFNRTSSTTSKLVLFGIK